MTPEGGGIACRRCGQVTEGQVVIYGPDDSGALVAKRAQCHGPCRTAGAAQEAAPAVREDPGEVLMAKRPGRCCACPRDIAPGDYMIRIGPARFVHFECAPASAGDRAARSRSGSR